MNKAFSPAYLINSFCCALTLAVPPISATEDAATNAASPATERAYKDSIASIESTQGAYGADLAETLLGMALALQSQGRHEEAVSQFKRGIHLARVNEGLYSTLQVPLLQGEIASHIALQNYALVDERQRYLYRVQTKGIESSHTLTLAFQQQAHWQYQAYLLGLGQQRYIRLMDMLALYQLARDDVIAREGENSLNLLPPLYGMLKAQYLISTYRPPQQEPTYQEDVRVDRNRNRFIARQAQSYRQGSTIIASIYQIQEEHRGTELATAEALVMLGDWRLWHGDQQAAAEAYAAAQTELVQRDDAQIYIEQVFGEPVALPDIDGLRPLPPDTEPDGADILLEFAVNERGRVTNLQRLDENEEQDGRARRLMKGLSNTQFRPRFEAGQVVETQNIVKAFDIQ